jgi:hypothetical protein
MFVLKKESFKVSLSVQRSKLKTYQFGDFPVLKSSNSYTLWSNGTKLDGWCGREWVQNVPDGYDVCHPFEGMIFTKDFFFAGNLARDLSGWYPNYVVFERGTCLSVDEKSKSNFVKFVSDKPFETLLKYKDFIYIFDAGYFSPKCSLPIEIWNELGFVPYNIVDGASEEASKIVEKPQTDFVFDTPHVPGCVPFFPKEYCNGFVCSSSLKVSDWKTAAAVFPDLNFIKNNISIYPSKSGNDIKAEAFFDFSNVRNFTRDSNNLLYVPSNEFKRLGFDSSIHIVKGLHVLGNPVVNNKDTYIKQKNASSRNCSSLKEYIVFPGDGSQFIGYRRDEWEKCKTYASIQSDINNKKKKLTEKYPGLPLRAYDFNEQTILSYIDLQNKLNNGWKSYEDTLKEIEGIAFLFQRDSFKSWLMSSFENVYSPVTCLSYFEHLNVTKILEQNSFFDLLQRLEPYWFKFLKHVITNEQLVGRIISREF